MAIVIEANYSKKLGLPAYSSHSYSVTIKSEINDLSQVEGESAKLYAILQGSVDREIQEVGYFPQPLATQPTPERNGAYGSHPGSNGHAANGNGGDYWKCSDKQKELVLKIVEEHQLDKKEVEALAQDMFQKSVKALNKLEAGGLIADLLDKYGPTRNGNGHTPDRGQNYNGRGTRR